MNIPKEQAVAFRWDRNGLNKLSPAADWRELLVSPMLDSPPGMAPLSLAARSDGEAPFTEIVGDAWEKKEIAYVTAIRFMVCLIRPEDIDPFTLGMQPPDGDYSVFYPHVAKLCRERGFDLRDIHPIMLDTMREALKDGPMRISDLSMVMNMMFPPPLQNLDQSMFRFSQYATLPAFMSGCFEYLPRIDSQRVIALREGGEPRAPTDEHRRRLARAYLRHYGPSTLKDFGQWLGFHPSVKKDEPSAATLAWDLIGDECAEITCGGMPMRILSDDLDALHNAPPPAGIRLLSPRDPYMGQKPREWIVPEAGLRKLVWPAVVPPGTLHWDGRLCGIWKLKKNGKNGEMFIDAFDPLVYAACRKEIEMWAERIAVARGVALKKLEMK